MTPEEYDAKLEYLANELAIAKRELAIKYTNEQRKFAIGDIIQDHCKILIIEKFGTYIGLERYPIPTYAGPLLRKDLMPMKNKDKGFIYGNDGVTLLKAAPVKKEIIPAKRLRTTCGKICKECDATESDIY